MGQCFIIIAGFARRPKPTALWEAIAFNQAHYYNAEEVNLDSSRDSVILVEPQQEEGSLDDAPAPVDQPSLPGPLTPKVTYGSEDIRYKIPKRTDRTPSTSSSDGSWIPTSTTRGRGRSPFHRGGTRGRTSASPAKTFKSPGSVTRSASRNAYDKSQASTRDSQRKKNQKEAEGQSSSSPAPGDYSRKRKTKHTQIDPASNSDIEVRIDDLEYQINGMQSNITDSIVSQMCRKFEEYTSNMESTVLSLR